MKNALRTAGGRTNMESKQQFSKMKLIASQDRCTLKEVVVHGKIVQIAGGIKSLDPPYQCKKKRLRPVSIHTPATTATFSYVS